MTTFNRRRFLAGAAALGGAAAVGTVRPALGLTEPDHRRAPVIPASTLPAAPADNPVEHIIVFMLENRSYDTYLGWLEGSRGFLAEGLELSYTDPDTGETHSPAHWAPEYRRTHEHPDPSHSWSGGRGQLANGFLDGRNDPYALAYYLPEDIPHTVRIARQFTVFDDYFCAVLGPTYPNRLYQHSGQSGGLKVNLIPGPHTDYPQGYEWPTIWDRLDDKDVSNAYYCVDLPAIGLFGPRMFHKIRHIEQFYADLAAGTLPKVTFVDPGFLTNYRTDDHPAGADMRASQAFLNNIVHAVTTSPLWAKTALFVNYDEWGGFFDHVEPPRTDDDERADANNHDEDFGQRGFRVPCLAISPYSRKGYVHQDGPYDHTSILRFIEWRYDLEPLTLRTANAKNIGDAFDYTQEPRLDIGIDQIETPTVFFSSGEDPAEPEAHATTDFDKLAAWVQAQGWTIPKTSWDGVFGFGQGAVSTTPKPSTTIFS